MYAPESVGAIYHHMNLPTGFLQGLSPTPPIDCFNTMPISDVGLHNAVRQECCCRLKTNITRMACVHGQCKTEDEVVSIKFKKVKGAIGLFFYCE
jgi:hypothetical protein